MSHEPHPTVIVGTRNDDQLSGTANPLVPLSTFSKGLDAVYECACSGQWQDVLGIIATLSRSDYCVLGFVDPKNNKFKLAHQIGVSKKRLRSQEDQPQDIADFLRSLLLLPVGAVATRSLIEDDSPKSFCDAIGFRMPSRGRLRGVLAAQRMSSKRRYTDSDVRLLNLLAPHICRSMLISDTLKLSSLKSETLEAALNTFAPGIFLTDRQGHVAFMNSKAESQLRNKQPLKIGNNRLVATNPNARNILAKALVEASSANEKARKASSLALPSNHNQGFVAHVLPLPSNRLRKINEPKVTAAIFVQDPLAETPISGQAFADLYGLTPCELRVLQASSLGLCVNDIADTLKVSTATVKTHLQHVYAKTGTTNRAALVRLLLNASLPIAS